MSSRYKAPTAPDEYYHIYGSGNNKRNIVRDTKDRVRLLFSLLHFQSPHSIVQINRIVNKYLQSDAEIFEVDPDLLEAIIADRFVELITFCIMPNHFHAIVKEVEESGISKYMQKTGIGFTRYFNIIHEQRGHVFGGNYNRVHISTNEQLLYTSAYVHKNPAELPGWRGKEDQYPWSSYPDYVHGNRWGNLLCQDMLLEQFNDSPEQFKKMTDEGGAKELKNLIEEFNT